MGSGSPSDFTGYLNEEGPGRWLGAVRDYSLRPGKFLICFLNFLCRLYSFAMDRRWGPPEELPECAVECFREGVSAPGCDQNDLSCWCDGGNQETITEAMSSCLEEQDDDCDTRFSFSKCCCCGLGIILANCDVSDGAVLLENVRVCGNRVNNFVYIAEHSYIRTDRNTRRGNRKHLIASILSTANRWT